MRGTTGRYARIAAISFGALLLLSGCSGAQRDAAAGASTSPTTAPTSTSTSASAASASTPASTTAPASPATTHSPIVNLPTDTRADYQLGGAYPLPAGVGIVSRDSTDEPARGAYSICYINAFQSQPQDAKLWLDSRGDLLLRDATGQPVIDANWPDEMLFDTSSAAKRERIAAIIGTTITGCAASGFDAVEFDNLDSWSRSKGALTEQNSLQLAALLVGRAHAAGLAAGQKNSAELADKGRDDAGFDFAVAEECYRYDECGSYRDVYGDHVIDIEYTDDLRGTFAAACADPATPRSTVLRDRELTTPASADYVYEGC